jgi:hypothetical protein
MSVGDFRAATTPVPDTCGQRLGNFLTRLSLMLNICFANSMIVALLLRFPTHILPHPNTVVAVALPGTLDPPGPHHYRLKVLILQG